MQSDKSEYVTWVQAQTNKVKESIDIIIEKLKEPHQETEKWRKNITHNNFYKTLYNVLKFSRELLSKILPQHALEVLDLTSLAHIPETMHNFEGRERLCDMAFIVDYKNNKDKHAIIVLEFQSTARKGFVWRMFEYKCSMVHDLQDINSNFADKKLPRIYMVAYYNGNRKWNSPLNMLELFDDPVDGEKDEDALNSIYYLFDVRHRDHEELDGINDLTSLIFRVERALYLKDQKQSMSLILDIMNLAQKLLYEQEQNDDKDQDNDKKYRFNGVVYRAILRWCERVTMTFGLRAFVARREPEDAMDIAKAFYDKAKEDGVIIGIEKGKAEGRAEKTASDICKIFKLAFKTAAPEKLVKLVSSLQKKGDQNNLDKLQQFIYEEKGSKDDFLRYAESLGT
ncbi:MAG: Rpn family recombination-promoting nuclease/putative transposase [Proteobacteria bacterium]|uniref:Rpn family recombination-promoting nuclease/putative transposase n=1 Tax=Candidatus Avisuccinivibrio stercorigallinarum TaxID=2840704 RepID=A0A9D9D857_9GAMM|nr:Rpn family recombination-promoting nuclease/putative transposase [Candidatus Avisuccinivibrio stercorigallinarum]